MVYKTCSINKFIAQFYRDFKPSHSGWIDDAVEWVGDAIDIMKCAGGYGEHMKKIDIIDYRGKLPCDLDSLLGFSYNGRRLPRNGGLSHKNLKTAQINLFENDTENSYTLTPNYVNVSFQTGCIYIHYLGIEEDCDGYPTIIDDAIYREALTWYVLMKLLGRGFKHQTFTYADAESRWFKTYPRAQNRCRMFDIDGYQHFKKTWLGLINTNDPTKVFFNSVDFQKMEDKSFIPGSLLQTFSPLGTNQNNINTSTNVEDDDSRIIDTLD